MSYGIKMRACPFGRALFVEQCTPPQCAGAWTLSTLDNGVISKEYWTTVDAADDLSWAVLHYSGTGPPVHWIAGSGYSVFPALRYNRPFAAYAVASLRCFWMPRCCCGSWTELSRSAAVLCRRCAVEPPSDCPAYPGVDPSDQKLDRTHGRCMASGSA